MKKFTQVILLCLLSIGIFGQENFNLELISNVPNGEEGNDIWGYVDAQGTEYAIMGTFTKTRIWSLEDPANPIERAAIPGPAGVWRDIKSYEDHLYVTSDQGEEGLLIIDMSMAPDSISHTYWKPNLDINGVEQTLGKCHNLYIDTTDGYCYLAGCNVGEEGVLILDLKQDKKEPVLAGIMNNNYTHDVYVRDNKMYTSDIFLGSFNVYDVTRKDSLVYLGGALTSRRFAHNAWLSDDGNYLFTTDERANAWVDAFDVSDLNDIQFLDRYRPLETEGTNVIPHNTHYYRGFLVTSWYTDGLVVVDAHKPDNLIKVAAYDTELEFTEDFEGCWGAYPYLPSGLVLASDINHGLFVFQPRTQSGEAGYQRACYLEGRVTDAKSGLAIPNANIEIISNDPNIANTDLAGNYKTGQVTAGEFSVEFSHPLYNSKILTAVIESGEVTILNAELENSELSGVVLDEGGNPIEGAEVLVENLGEQVTERRVTNAEGRWSVNIKENITYIVYAAKWGYKGNSESILFEPGETVELTLERGYEDDFFANLGWVVSSTASSGIWEIAIPPEVSGSGQITQTPMDILDDLGFSYYITGAGAGSQGADDIDNGFTTITSPTMDFTDMDQIEFNYYIRFVNVSGQSEPNDFMTVSLTNGQDTLELTRQDENQRFWSAKYEVLVDSSEIAFNDQMQVIVFAIDQSPGNVVEVGFDAFEAKGIKVTSTNEIVNTGLRAYPNPTHNLITLSCNEVWDGNNKIIVVDNVGRTVHQSRMSGKSKTLNVQHLPAGLYAIQIVGNQKRSETIRFSKL